ncbi:MAG TPA: hypothetical protein IAA80_07625 [Candidatus Gallacutalibacter pullistercoris]|nr:hypothetical protein [Candidatus Gallacutalibacter pullistercoris]
MQREEWIHLAMLAKLSAEEELEAVLPRLNEMACFFDQVQAASVTVKEDGALAAQLRNDEVQASLPQVEALNGTGRDGFFLFETKGEKA